MTGRYDHTIDPKGRLFLPSKLRSELGNPIYLAVGSDFCLDIYPQAAWDALAEKGGRAAQQPGGHDGRFLPMPANASRTASGAFSSPDPSGLCRTGRGTW